MPALNKQHAGKERQAYQGSIVGDSGSIFRRQKQVGGGMAWATGRACGQTEGGFAATNDGLLLVVGMGRDRASSAWRRGGGRHSGVGSMAAAGGEGSHL